MKIKTSLIVSFIGLLLLFSIQCLSSKPLTSEDKSSGILATVNHVVDGDTIVWLMATLSDL
jgi:endonuclease YncB( thermonuclease family)